MDLNYKYCLFDDIDYSTFTGPVWYLLLWDFHHASEGFHRLLVVQYWSPEATKHLTLAVIFKVFWYVFIFVLRNAYLYHYLDPVNVLLFLHSIFVIVISALVSFHVRFEGCLDMKWKILPLMVLFSQLPHLNGFALFVVLYKRCSISISWHHCTLKEPDHFLRTSCLHAPKFQLQSSTC